MQQRKFFTVNNKEYIYIYDMFSIYCACYNEHIHMYSHTTVNVMGQHCQWYGTTYVFVIFKAQESNSS